jgi:uncharacterized protein YdhG (YjbR/CyaY superfamily)
MRYLIRAMPKPKTIDEYLAGVEPEPRKTLDQLRRTIHAIRPDVEECISYSMPAFRVDGHVVAGFLATQKGCSYYPFSGTTLATLAEDLVAYDQTKSALHFGVNRALPAVLVRKLLRARIAEIESKSRKPQRKASPKKAPGRSARAPRVTR